jgi:DNA invertase Pin-like site-specific DNA recombinase
VRSGTNTAILIDRIESAGASLALVSEDFEQSTTGTFLRGAKAFAAELEREKISERTQRGRRWCQRVGSNLDDLTYSERRLALEALGVQVKVYSNQRADENGDPIARWTVTLDSMPCLNSSSLLTT